MAIPTTSGRVRFVGQPGGVLSNQNVTLRTGVSLNVGLIIPPATGFWGAAGITVSTDGSPRFTGRVSIALSGWQGGNPTYRVTGFRSGPVRLLASKGANTLDSVDITVVGQEAAAMTVLDAMDTRRITLPPSDATYLRNSINGSETVIIDPLIVEMLAALLRQGSVDVLSLVRRGKSQHGIVQGNKVICKAVDFSGFGGVPVVSSGPPDRLMDVVCRMLSNFPECDLDVGFPRPKGGPTGFDPTHDVFFSVPDQATAQKCYDSTIALPLSAMLEPARGRVTQAMQQSRARFHVLYPDGLDHMHVALTQYPQILVQLP